MADATHCFDLMLGNQLPWELPPVVVAHGDDGFLRREAVVRILQLAGIDIDQTRGFDGDECEWIDVHDELATLSLFEPDARRVAIVARADRLISASRPQLEKWFASPAPASVLLLQVQTFPGNTKLYKLAGAHGQRIDCSLPTDGPRSKTPSERAIKGWVQGWGKAQHGLSLTAAQATRVVEAVGTDCGLLHQELSKLALYAGAGGKLTDDQVRQHVGTWRTRTMWEISDSIIDGRIAEALERLDRVVAAGEQIAGAVPQIAWSLRRYGNAAQLLLQAQRTGQSLTAQAAISRCGFWGNDSRLAEGRLRRLGLRRAGKLLEWLLELDLKIKGSHGHPDRARFALEEFCFRLG